MSYVKCKHCEASIHQVGDLPDWFDDSGEKYGPRGDHKHEPADPPQTGTEKCGQLVRNIIAGSSWIPCALDKGHAETGHRGEGNCFAHGPYLGEVGLFPECPQCKRTPQTGTAEGMLPPSYDKVTKADADSAEQFAVAYVAQVGVSKSSMIDAISTIRAQLLALTAQLAAEQGRAQQIARQSSEVMSVAVDTWRDRAERAEAQLAEMKNRADCAETEMAKWAGIAGTNATKDDQNTKGSEERAE